MGREINYNTLELNELMNLDYNDEFNEKFKKIKKNKKFDDNTLIGKNEKKKETKRFINEFEK